VPVFWWYWSSRQRLMLLLAVLSPLVAFFVFRTVLSGDAASPAPAPASSLPVATASSVDGDDAVPGEQADTAGVLVLAEDDSRSAASRFPATFGDFGMGVVATHNLVFPGQSSEAYSLYLFYDAAVGAAEPSEAVTPPGGSVPVTAAPREPAPSGSDPGDLLGQVREKLRWHFNELGAVVTDVRTRSETEMMVVGLESNRGFRATLRFLEVPSGVVVTGLVSEIAANEASDAIEESKVAREGTVGEGGTPPTAVPADGPAATTIPSAGSPSTVSPPVTTVPTVTPSTVPPSTLAPRPGR